MVQMMTTMDEVTQGFRWYVPSFYGDVRVVRTGPKTCEVLVEMATVEEAEALRRLGDRALKKKWIDAPLDVRAARTSFFAPVEKVAREIAAALKPGRRQVSVVRFASGRVEEVSEGTFVVAPSPSPPPPYRGGEAPAAPAAEPVPARVVDRPTAAVTVASPTVGCPPPDFSPAEVRAREVLAAFLDPGQLADFRQRNRFVSVGGASGHRYMITSRRAEAALRTYRRSLYDLDERLPICTHDWTVPEAEEVLALHLLVSLPRYEGYLRGLT